MNKRTLVLDFDGTLTDLGRQGPQYQDLYYEEFSNMSGVSRHDLEQMVAELTPTILSDPMKGWEIDGRIMAPAGADPYMIFEAVFNEISTRLGYDSAKSEKIRSDCFHATYPKCEPHFREDTSDFLKAASERYNVTIISNSRTDQIKRKLDGIGHGGIRIKGDAKKFIPHPNWHAVPETISIPGFVRKIELRRKQYGEALTSIDQDASNIVVMGDIFEMDLALPEYLGAQIIHISNGHKLAHEIEYMKSGNRRHYVEGLNEAVRVLQL